MRRWSEVEQKGLDEIRLRLKDELATLPQHPDSVGDRKLLRFFRGHNYDADIACEMISKYIAWRKSSNVDAIRHAIVHEGCNHPSRFPNGEKILSLIPQIVIDHNMRDQMNCPIVFEQYNFRPAEVLSNISLEEYVQYVTYCLEFRSLIVEQLSEEQERNKLKALEARRNSGEDISGEEPYGVICHICVIRDLGGVGFDHIGSQGQEIIRAVLGIATDNYPELMRKCHMINAPWIFNTIWWIIKGWLAARTIAKINVLGSTFLQELQEDITLENIPAAIGGYYSKSQDAFIFDAAEGGALYSPPP